MKSGIEILKSLILIFFFDHHKEEQVRTEREGMGLEGRGKKGKQESRNCC